MGALLALMLTHTDLSIIAMIGIILLIGLVKKNGILMVDFALAAERNEGKSPRDAIFEASLLRFRPILMTTMAAMLGALPLALGTGTGSELRRPLGITIIGGLIMSQVLTLFTTPVVYLYFDRLRTGGSACAASKHRRPEPVGVEGPVGVRRISYRVPSRQNRFARRPARRCRAASLPAASRAPPTSARPPPCRKAFKEAPPAGWKEAQPSDGVLRGKWWEIFSDPALNALEEQVSISNQNVLQAEAQFREARAAVRVARSALFPLVSLNPSVTGSQGSGRVSSRFGPTSPLGNYDLPVNASYTVDLWGSIRRSVTASANTAQSTAAPAGECPPALSVGARPGLLPIARRRWRYRPARGDRPVLPGVARPHAQPLRRRHRLR